MKWLTTYYHFLTFILCLTSCSNDDMGNSERGSERFLPDILVISENNDNIYQTDIFNDGEDIYTYNLTSELNLVNQEYIFIHHNNLINLVSRDGVNYKVSQKNTESSEILILSNICNLEEDEFGFRPIITNNRIAMVTLKDLIYEGLFKIKSYDTKNQLCEEINLGNEEVVGTVLVRGETVFITQVKDGNVYKIRKIDLTSMTVVQEIEFDEVFKASEKEGKLYVFFRDNSYDIYNSATFEKLGSSNLNFNYLPPSLGLFEINLYDNTLEIEVDYIQPSALDSAPGTVNIATGEVLDGGDFFALDLIDILSANYTANITLMTYVVDLKNEVIVYGFDVGDVGGDGGVIFTNYQNEVLKLVELQSVPYIISKK